MNKPLVSIIIPVFNGSNYMQEAINSALQQTYDNCEVIVVDDGSTDDGLTEKIAGLYGDRIRYFRKENGGVATAVNYGIEHMRGEYFSWLSHDDVFYPQKIELQMEAVKKSGDPYSVVHGNFDFFNMDGYIKSSVDWLGKYRQEWMENGAFSPVFLAIHGSTILLHKDNFNRVGLYDTKLKATQDSEFLFRVMRGHRSVFLKEKLIIGRLHRQQGQKTMSCHKPEYNAMFRHFCEELSDDEMISFCGSVTGFYYQLYLLLKTCEPADEILDYLLDKLSVLANEPDIQEVQPGNEEDLNNIYIFGAGMYGRQLKANLSGQGIEPAGFLDNDAGKWGRSIDGLKCFSPEILKEKSFARITVAMQDPAEVEKQLKKLQGIETIPYQEIQYQMFMHCPSNRCLQDFVRQEEAGRRADNEMVKART